MVRRHMYKACTAVSGDEVACEHRAGLRKEAAEMMHWVADEGINKPPSLEGTIATIDSLYP